MSSLAVEDAPAAAPRMLRRLGHDTQYVLIGFPLGIVSLVLAVAGFSLGVSLAVLAVGVPLLFGTLMLARMLAAIERVRAGNVPRPAYRTAPAGAGWWRRVTTPMADPQSWFDLLHATFRIIPSTISFAFVVTWWAGALGGLTFWLWQWSIPWPADNTDLPQILGFESRILFYTLCGLVFAVTLVPVVRWAAALQSGFARVLLGLGAEIRTRDW